jgi:hypothetical protein
MSVTAGGFGSNVMGFAADGAAGLPDNWIGGPFAIGSILINGIHRGSCFGIS